MNIILATVFALSVHGGHASQELPREIVRDIVMELSGENVEVVGRCLGIAEMDAQKIRANIEAKTAGMNGPPPKILETTDRIRDAWRAALESVLANSPMGQGADPLEDVRTENIAWATALAESDPRDLKSHRRTCAKKVMAAISKLR